jgi:uncharacterized protein (DUF1810 family)
MPAEYNLERFLTAQAPVYGQALAELRDGCKRSHWMWFVFPQLAGLGRSPTAQFFAIGSRDEAQQYLAHPVLGARLRECTEALLALPRVAIEDVLGFPDNLKFRSSMTLFGEVAGPGSIFQQALERYWGGEPDPVSLELLKTL